MKKILTTPKDFCSSTNRSQHHHPLLNHVVGRLYLISYISGQYLWLMQLLLFLFLTQYLSYVFQIVFRVLFSPLQLFSLYVFQTLQEVDHMMLLTPICQYLFKTKIHCVQVYLDHSNRNASWTSLPILIGELTRDLHLRHNDLNYIP